MTLSTGLLSLHKAAALIPGADADTLKRLHRRGKLTVYRVGKAYSTTPADMEAAIQQCRVVPKVRVYGSAPLVPAALPLGLSSTDLASSELDLALVQLKKKKTKPSART